MIPVDGYAPLESRLEALAPIPCRSLGSLTDTAGPLSCSCFGRGWMFKQRVMMSLCLALNAAPSGEWVHCVWLPHHFHLSREATGIIDSD